MKTPWASIARIEIDGIHSGTGFLIGPDHLVTALHVVATPEGRPLGGIALFFNTAAEFDDNSPILKTTATLVPGLWDHSQDFAVLKCDDPLPAARPLIPTARCLQFQKFSSPGFAMQDANGFTGIGKIASLNDPASSGGPIISLQFDFGTGLLMRGHSGAPVFVDGLVVGLLRTAFLDERKLTMGGIVQATSIRYVVECCRKQSPTLLTFRPGISWPSPKAEDKPVVADRKREFSDFERMITGQCEQRVLLLEGASGTGKTVIAEEFERYARSLDVIVASADLKGCPTMDQIFGALLITGGEGVFKQAESADRPQRFFRMMDDIMALEKPFLLLFDGWKEAPDELRKWIKNTVSPKLSLMPHVIVMITGQEVPDPSAANWKELVICHQLTPIHSTEDWYEFCNRKWPASPIARQHIESLLLVAKDQLMPSEVCALLKTLQSRLPALGALGAGR